MIPVWEPSYLQECVNFMVARLMRRGGRGVDRVGGERERRSNRGVGRERSRRGPPAGARSGRLGGPPRLHLRFPKACPALRRLAELAGTA